MIENIKNYVAIPWPEYQDYMAEDWFREESYYDANKDIFYVACINEVLCENCITDYVKNMSHYTDDDSLKYEINHFNIVAQKLGMSEKAGLAVDKKIVITI